jgi:hypothetical protein
MLLSGQKFFPFIIGIIIFNKRKYFHLKSQANPERINMSLLILPDLSLHGTCGSCSIFESNRKTIIADSGCLYRIPDPNFVHPESRIQDQKDPGPPDRHQRIEVFLTQKTVSMLSEKLSGMVNPDPGSGFFPIPDPGVKKHRIPDPGVPQHYRKSINLILCKAWHITERGLFSAMASGGG